MPIYEYKCKNCGEIFEILVSTGADSQGFECTKCKGESLEKIISASNVSTKRAAPDRKGACCGTTSSMSNPSCAGPGSCCN